MKWRIGFFRMWVVLAICWWGWTVFEVVSATAEEQNDPGVILFKADEPVRKACRQKIQMLDTSSPEIAAFDQHAIIPESWFEPTIRRVAECARSEWWITNLFRNVKSRLWAWLQPFGVLFLGWLGFIVGGWVLRGFRA